MRPAEVEQLITDLRVEKPHSNVAVQPESEMVILIEETDDRHVFNADECRLILSGKDTIERFFEAMDYPDEVIVELHGLAIDAEVMAELESFASTVDEM